MKNLFRTALSVIAFTTVVNAGVLVDVKVGTGSHMDVAPSGSVTGYTLDGALGLDSAAQTSTYMEFSHLIPMIPNVKYEMNTLSFTGTATQTMTIGTQTYSANSASQFSWDHEDVTLYWGIPFSTWIPMIDAADFGLGAKLGDLSMGITGVGETNFSFGAIYYYGRMHISPPMFFGLGLEAEYKTFSGNENGATMNFTESTYKLDWFLEAPIPVIDLSVGVEAGYRAMDYQLTVGGEAFDLGFSGVFFNVVGKFGI